MLRVRNVTYKTNGKTILDDVSADFEAGSLNVVIGPNGAGKSTLIKIVSSQISPQKGSVLYGDKPIRSFSISELARFRAVLSQEIEIPFPVKVLDVVMMGRYPHFAHRAAQRDEIVCEAAMCLFGVWEMAGRNYMTLSGGEKQRVQFAKVLAQIWHPNEHGCRYLLLDEPLTFLDVRYQFEFMRKTLGLLKCDDLVVIAVVHDLNLAARFADKILLLDGGRLLACGTKSEVLTKENVKAAYGLNPVIHHIGEAMHLFFQPEDPAHPEANGNGIVNPQCSRNSPPLKALNRKTFCAVSSTRV